MSGETEASVSGWTVDTLHSHVIATTEHLEQLVDVNDRRYSELFRAQEVAMSAALAAAEKAVAAALAAAEKATTKAELAADKRFEAVNEFRQALADATSTNIPRTEHAAVYNSLVEKNDFLASRLDKLEGNRSGERTKVTDNRANLGTIIGVIGVVIAFLSIITTIVIVMVSKS